MARRVTIAPAAPAKKPRRHQSLAMISCSPRYTAGRLGEAVPSGGADAAPGAAERSLCTGGARAAFRYARRPIGRMAHAENRRRRRPEAANRAPFPTTATRRRYRRSRSMRIAAATKPGSATCSSTRPRWRLDFSPGIAQKTNRPRREMRRPARSRPCACRARNGAARRVRGADRRCAGSHRPRHRRLRTARAEKTGRAGTERPSHSRDAALRCGSDSGSEPAGFHSTPRNSELPPGCCRPVAETLPEYRRNVLKDPG